MLLVAVLFGLVAGDAADSAVRWQQVVPGLELARVALATVEPAGEAQVVVVRIDPASWELALVGQSTTGESTGRSAREWAEAHDLALAINSGMFAQDYTTHLGYLEYRGSVHSSRINQYQSVAAFDPRDTAKLPAFRIFDLDEPGVSVENIRADYGSLVQNLRLIKRPGTNRWTQKGERWSEAALAEDGEGRILFIYSPTPFAMQDFIRELLASGLGIVAAQHLEGGRLAQLHLKLGDVDLELHEGASAPASAGPGRKSARAWPIPNVIGARPRAAKK